jgi:phage terminase small subunit
MTPRRRLQAEARIERFCQELVQGKSQSDAYRAAFKPKRAKQKTIHDMASKAAGKPEVIQRLQELMPVVKAHTKLTAERWQEEIDRCALLDPRKLFDTHGNPMDIPDLSDEEAPGIAGFEIVEEFSGRGAERVPVGYTRKYKLVNKLQALELAGKARGYYIDRSQPPIKGITIIFQKEAGAKVAVVVNPTGRTSIVPTGETKHPKLPVTFRKPNGST